MKTVTLIAKCTMCRLKNGFLKLTLMVMVSSATKSLKCVLCRMLAGYKNTKEKSAEFTPARPEGQKNIDVKK